MECFIDVSATNKIDNLTCVIIQVTPMIASVSSVLTGWLNL